MSIDKQKGEIPEGQENENLDKLKEERKKNYLLKSDLWYDRKLLESGSKNSLSKLKQAEIDKLIEKGRIE